MEPTTQRPQVGIGVMVMREGKVLLGKRKGSHGAGEYAWPGGHLEAMESFADCAAREVMEETGMSIGPISLVRVLNLTAYAPKHYVDLAFAAEWKGGEPEVREPDKVESWDWYDVAQPFPEPLFAGVASAIAALRFNALVRFGIAALRVPSWARSSSSRSFSQQLLDMDLLCVDDAKSR